MNKAFLCKCPPSLFAVHLNNRPARFSEEYMQTRTPEHNNTHYHIVLFFFSRCVDNYDMRFINKFRKSETEKKIQIKNLKRIKRAMIDQMTVFPTRALDIFWSPNSLSDSLVRLIYCRSNKHQTTSIAPWISYVQLRISDEGR